MNVRDAILKTCALLIARPDLWHFMRTTVPECGGPGCALGLIGANLGCSAGSTLDVVYEQMKIPSSLVFYGQLNALGDRCWHESPERAVKALRLYADKYHPAEAPRTLDPAFIAFRDKFADAFSAA